MATRLFIDTGAVIALEEADDEKPPCGVGICSNHRTGELQRARVGRPRDRSCGLEAAPKTRASPLLANRLHVVRLDGALEDQRRLCLTTTSRGWGNIESCRSLSPPVQPDMRLLSLELLVETTLHAQRVYAHRLRRCARQERTRHVATAPTHPTVDGCLRRSLLIGLPQTQEIMRDTAELSARYT